MAEAQGISLNQFALYVLAKEVQHSDRNVLLRNIGRGNRKKGATVDKIMHKVPKRKVPLWDRL
jgi:hypothetical protein